MGILSNARHERFAKNIAQGKSSREACADAGAFPMPSYKPAGFYVYALIDPETDAVFYIGKGKGSRFAQHEKQAAKGSIANVQKHNRILAIWASKQSVVSVCVQDGMNEREAYEAERHVIATIGIGNLTNAVRGQSTEIDRQMAQIAYVENQICAALSHEIKRGGSAAFAKISQGINIILEMREASALLSQIQNNQT